MPARRFLHSFLGLFLVLLFAAVLWAPYVANHVPGLSLEAIGGVARFRMLGAGAFLALLIVRFLIRPPKQPSRRSIAWGEFAGSAGGTVTEEARRIGPMGWTGGTTVRWNSRGAEVILSAYTDTDRNVFTQFAADVRLAHAFQFHVIQETMLTRALSTHLWNAALAAVKEREKRAGAGTTSGPRGVAERLAFLGEKDLLLGDPKLDDAFLVKSDTPALAREFLVDAGVASCLHEMNEGFKGWQLSLMSRGVAGAHQLILAIPGAILDPPGLDASRKLIEASIRCLADRGMLASDSPRAA